MLLIILYQWLIYTSATLTELKLSVFRAASACPCILTFCPIHQHFKNLTIGTESGVSKCWSYVHVCTCKHTVSKEFIFNFKDHTSTKTDILTIAKFNNAYTMWHSFRNYWKKSCTIKGFAFTRPFISLLIQEYSNIHGHLPFITHRPSWKLKLGKFSLRKPLTKLGCLSPRIWSMLGFESLF